jgi:hypothetical protein
VIGEDVALDPLDLLACVEPDWVSRRPSFCADLALWLSRMAADGLASRPSLPAHRDIESIVNMRQRAVPCPQLEIAVHGTLGGKILRQAAPRATALQHVKQPADHRTDVDPRAGGRRVWRAGSAAPGLPIRYPSDRSGSGTPIGHSALGSPSSTCGVPALLGTTYRITTDSPDSTSFRTGS